MSSTKLLSSLVLAAAMLCPTSAHAFKLKTAPDGRHTVRWPEGQVTLQIDPSAEAVLGREALRAAATMASDAWRGLPGAPDVVIADGAPAAYDSERRNNGIYLVSPWPFEPSQVAMTVTTFTQQGRVLGADVLLNGERDFDLLQEGSSAVQEHPVHDLGAVLTHELGHLLGLDHNEQDPESTMWKQVGAGEMHQRSVEADDEDGLIAVYAVALEEPAAAGASCTVATRPGSSNAAGVLAAMTLILLARRRTRR